MENKFKEGDVGSEPRKVKLIKQFAGYPVGEYRLSGGDMYMIDAGRHKVVGIHKDIVQGMKDHFEPIEEPKREGWINEVLNEVGEEYIFTPEIKNNKELWTRIREAIEKHLPRITNTDIIAHSHRDHNGEIVMGRFQLERLLKSKGLLE